MESRSLSRRQALTTLGLVAASAPLVLAGCGSDDAGDRTITGSNPTDAGTGTGTGTAQAWATGGTASMTGTYPDPFASGLGTACNLTCAATVGPCYAQTLARKDISEGQAGLPVRLAFLVVDASCNPVANAEVDVWHAAPKGVYSGSDASAMCTLNDAEALAARYFRGTQTTDANGRVDIDTCFPGWYRGRTVHVHFTVRVNGTEYVTSQLGFDDALVDDIVANQPLYKDRGARDTTNANDNIISAEYVFAAARQADGAMLASKALVLRASTADSVCSIGGSGMDGPGAPPGG
jgi:protocatechuate 3,4-dioxygenase beta subunit